MLEKPDLPESHISACLQDEYGLAALCERVVFLPLGADRNAAVYRADAEDGNAYFVKLRRGAFNEISTALPKFLSDCGAGPIIPPLATRSGQLWTDLDGFKLILYPFIEGHDGYTVGLTEQQWGEFGAAISRIHRLELPPALSVRIPRENYSAAWREMLRKFVGLIDESDSSDPVAAELAGLVRARLDTILDLVERAGHLARALQGQPPKLVVCHADIHAGNLLIEGSGAFYIVDWDEPILAPKERDLMSISAGLFGAWRAPQEEETLFYRGYGETQIHAAALAYYRYERIIDDLAVECRQIFLNEAGSEDREQALKFFKSNFMPGDTIEIAYESDQTQEEDH
jgi:spectinomycin phosphotransferase